MSRPTICAYAIFRNEAPRVARWLDSVADCDGWFVLDTGSTDGTVDELRRLGISYAQAEFHPFRFDDARNTALALVPTDFDLCLRLDADEVIEPGWRDAFEAVYQPNVFQYRYTVVNHGADIIWGQIRRDDLHARFGFRWRLPTHEVLEGPGGLPTVVPGMTVHHHAEPKDRSFNSSVLALAAITDPHDPRVAFYYARELWYIGAWELCRQEMQRFLAMPDGWGPERCEAYRVLAAIDFLPERWLWKAIGEAPERREPFVDLVRLYLRDGRLDEADHMLSLAGDRVDESVYTTDPRAWGTAFTELVAAVDRAIIDAAAQ